MTALRAQIIGRVPQLGMRLQSRFAPLAWQEQTVPSPFLQQTATRGPSMLHARRALLANSAEVRTVTIHGGQAEVFNLLVFPFDPQAMPLLVAEVFALRGKVKVAFFDLPYVGTDEQVHANTASELRSWSSSEPCLQAPTWATTYSTGGYVYQRNIDETDDLDEYLHRLISSWRNLHEWAVATTMHHGSEAASERLMEFKREHVEQAPTMGFLGACFGHTWATRFMNDFLYR